MKGSNLLNRGMHLVKGSPVNDSLQLQIGLWFLTTHIVLRPHALGQGSEHFCEIQALSNGHSALTTHSGLQPGGLPIYSSKQVQTACSLFTRHWLFGPQGDGKHGFLGFSVNAIQTSQLRVILGCVNQWLTFSLNCANSEWISGITFSANAGGQVINDLTNCIGTTCTRTGIFTFVSNACFISRTIRTESTFRSTAFIGISNIIWNTRTRARSILFFAYRIWPTRRWDAWCARLNHNNIWL